MIDTQEREHGVNFEQRGTLDQLEGSRIDVEIGEIHRFQHFAFLPLFLFFRRHINHPFSRLIKYTYCYERNCHNLTRVKFKVFVYTSVTFLYGVGLVGNDDPLPLKSNLVASNIVDDLRIKAPMAWRNLLQAKQLFIYFLFYKITSLRDKILHTFLLLL